MASSKSRAFAGISATGPLRIFRVGELTGYLKNLLESNEVLYDCWIAGEVSNVSQTVSGHFFFTVKERDAQMKCVLFSKQALWQTVLPQNGLAVLAHGYVSMYEATGNLQFYVDTLQEEGQGVLYLAYEQLKAQLEAEGLFALERKRPLPLMPRRIGVVTSPQAAALQDILNVLARRYPIAEVLLSPAQVQGDGAARQIATAIAALNSLQDDEAVDLIIVARGGGSIEELWAFNEEIVARAVYASRVPVVSGVGHETDVTIIDYVADLRAPTPSVAAELATPDMLDIMGTVATWRRMLTDDMQGRLAVAWDEIASEREQLQRLSPMWQVGNDRRQLDTMRKSMVTSLQHRLALDQERVSSAKGRLDALSPLQILKRGYAIVRDLDTGAVVSSIGEAQPGHLLEIRVANGAFGALVAENRVAEERQEFRAQADGEEQA